MNPTDPQIHFTNYLTDYNNQVKSQRVSNNTVTATVRTAARPQGDLQELTRGS